MADDFDPTADFLARERAALGDDADLFQTADTTPSVADNFSTPTLEPASITTDLLGGIDEVVSAATTTTAIPAPPLATSPQPTTTSPPPQQQSASSQFVKEWQLKQQEAIQERDKLSESKHETMINEAKEAIDKFYDEYNEKKEKDIRDNRANQEIEIQAASSGNLWERVVKQIDLATKSKQQQNGASENNNSSAVPRVGTPFGVGGQSRDAVQKCGGEGPEPRDTSRMRELIQDLRRDKNAPGVRTKAEAAA